jgi:hypothetical protein
MVRRVRGAGGKFKPAVTRMAGGRGSRRTHFDLGKMGFGRSLTLPARLMMRFGGSLTSRRQMDA